MSGEAYIKFTPDPIFQRNREPEYIGPFSLVEVEDFRAQYGPFGESISVVLGPVDDGYVMTPDEWKTYQEGRT